jgi:hypothetical protein
MTSCKRRLLSSIGFVALALVQTQAWAVTESYCTLPASITPGPWTLNQNAFEALGTEIRLTDAVANERASAWITSPIPIAAGTPVNADFRFQMGPNAAGGDGIAFVMQNSAAGAAALGTGVLQMGYGGITPSVVIQFNTYKNDANDPNSNNVSLMLNGVATAVPAATGTPPFTMAGGGMLYAWVNYTGTTLSVYVSNTATKPGAPIFGPHALNLFTQLGSAGQMYVGFTSSTGVSPEINEHDVYEFEISTAGIPCSCEGDSACSGATPACAASGICATCSATNHTACTGATPLCDVPVNTCVGCLTDANCSSPKPICDSVALSCRICTGNADCSGATPECATAGPNAGDCVLCVADPNCPPATPRCTASNVCVQCLSAADCGGDTPICNAGVCQACASDADCGGATPACEVWGACGQCSQTNSGACTGGTAVCDYPSGTCVTCEFNSDCAGSTPTCNTATHMCRPCASNADCAGNPGGPACELTGMKAGSCVICAQDSDCPNMAAPKCDTVANECVPCLTNADCSGSTPVCNSSNLCVGCVTNANCSGTTPVCNAASSQCSACQNDYAMNNPGPLSCPTPALVACQPSGACGLCSATNDSACVSLPATPVCIASSATCGCLVDTDCNADSYCDMSMVGTDGGVISSGVCTAGCRTTDDAGTTNCATGKYCTATSGSVGMCMSEPCNSKADCSSPNPVCDTIVQPHVCVQCLNDPDCTGSQVCNTANQCVACTAMQTQNCSATGSGSACLASGSCGCTTDTSCGGPLSGRVCNGTTHVCTPGCRGTGGNQCPGSEVCTSTSGSAGMCQAAPGMDSGMTSKDAGNGGVDASPAGHVVSQSAGCGCRIVDGNEETRAGGLGGLLVGLALAVRRRRAAKQGFSNQ